jgi:alkanesulfonate monooxygenase SsuD/methylene tetrahydromethanopterin reductase-like flavin-dependent oxidoreductase (luciferase family)
MGEAVGVQHALTIPPYGELADPSALVELSVVAERAGWDAVFLWDHVLRRPGDPQETADPWVAMAAMAVATEHVRLGPMVTPITRRRPIKLARECTTLDHLSGGRLTLGLGLGVDTTRELSAFGEVVDARERGVRLDEGAELLCQMWSGEEVDFHGEHFTADHVTVLPRPVQQPRIPMWFAARASARKPVRRAARYDGLYPIEVTEADLRAMMDLVVQERGSLDGFDVIVRPTEEIPYRFLEELGVTWAIIGPAPGDAGVFELAGSPPAHVFGIDG